MKKLMLFALCLTFMSRFVCAAGNEIEYKYEPAPEILKAQKEFSDNGFGIFIHWGIYSMFGQGEWYLNYGPKADEYAKAAAGFYPARFDASEWVKAFKDAGARYVTFTTRHHDGFSMFGTKQSDYNIVDATPFKRDVLKELADECGKQGLKLHLYYSHIDWTRPDYPSGRTGLTTGRDSTLRDWPKYYDFMNRQLRELLTNYGPIGAIWFDGWWDHDFEADKFDWQLPQQYAMIHELQPACLIANNHHENVFPDENIQIFERDVPGENTAGYSRQDISSLPLEMCQTMNGMWGYKIVDQNYKSVAQLIHLLVKARGIGSNVLLNIGPQPSGELPAAALERLKGIGEWMSKYGETYYAASPSDFPAQTWGTSTRKGNKIYVHILSAEGTEINVPTSAKVKSARAFDDKSKVKFTKNKDKGITLYLDSIPDAIDHIVELEIE